MTKNIIQHGPAKGQKIEISLKQNYNDGVIFSSREESFNSICNYVKDSDFLHNDNVFLDSQFYYSTFNLPDEHLKFLNEGTNFPNNVSRRDVRQESEEIYDYFDDFADKTSKISNSVITPGFYIDTIDWKFDYSINFYNLFKNKYQFEFYYLSLVFSMKIFHSKNDVDYLLEDIEDLVEKKDGIYLIISNSLNNTSNYETFDSETLSNILYFVYALKKKNIKVMLGYCFMNSLLFAMLDCDIVASGWFNNLRNFNENRFSVEDSFGRRKKKIFLKDSLSFLPIDTFDPIKDNIDFEFLSSDNSEDISALENQDSVSFVDLEHQYWRTLNVLTSEINSCNSIEDKISLLKSKIFNAKMKRDYIMDSSKGHEYIQQKVKEYFSHLDSWEIGIDLFIKKTSLIIK